MKKTRLFTYGLALIIFSSLFFQCKENKVAGDQAAVPTIEKALYGTMPDGQNIDIYTLKNTKGMEMKAITYGGIITSLKVPDKNGLYADIVLGHDSLSQYLRNNAFFGGIIGRYGNRIANGKFSIEGTAYQLTKNDGPNHLHGGNKGFDKVVWTAAESKTDSTVSLKLSYLAKDMEEGYPGNLQADVTYTLTNDNAIDILYEATTDKATIVNLTQHSYFNLSGDFTRNIHDHQLVLNADKYLPVDKTLIPTGKLADVAGTPFDFRSGKPIGRDIGADDEQLKMGEGFDHCWVLNGQGGGMGLAALAYHPESGRLLEIFTDEPGMQFYSGNFLDGTLPMRGEGTYAHRTGFCLETQHYPDTPNRPEFPPVLLKPGEQYVSHATFRFSVK